MWNCGSVSAGRAAGGFFYSELGDQQPVLGRFSSSFANQHCQIRVSSTASPHQHKRHEQFNFFLSATRRTFNKVFVKFHHSKPGKDGLGQFSIHSAEEHAGKKIPLLDNDVIFQVMFKDTTDRSVLFACQFEDHKEIYTENFTPSSSAEVPLKIAALPFCSNCRRARMRTPRLIPSSSVTEPTNQNRV